MWQARTLEQDNAILKAKISMFTNPEQGGPASTSIILTSAIGSYKSQIDALTATKEAIISEIEHYKGIIEDVQSRYVTSFPSFWWCVTGFLSAQFLLIKARKTYSVTITCNIFPKRISSGSFFHVDITDLVHEWLGVTVLLPFALKRYEEETTLTKNLEIDWTALKEVCLFHHRGWIVFYMILRSVSICLNIPLCICRRLTVSTWPFLSFKPTLADWKIR